MNTRSIIAKKIGHGYFTSWCWTDEEPAILGDILRKYFSSVEIVDELLKYRNILGIFADYKKDVAPSVPGLYSRLSNGFYIKHDDGKDVVVSGGFNGFFRSISDMLNEAVHFLYVFDPDNETWIIYKKRMSVTPP